MGRPEDVKTSVVLEGKMLSLIKSLRLILLNAMFFYRTYFTRFS